MLSHNLVLKLHILETNKTRMALKEAVEALGLKESDMAETRQRTAAPAAPQAPPREDCRVNVEREIRTNGIFSERCQMFPQTKNVFQSCMSCMAAWNNSEMTLFRV